MTTTADHDAYIAATPEQFRPTLRRLRTLLSHALPDADEIVAYNMPGFTIGGSVVARYAAFSKQCGLYVLPGAIPGHADEIATAPVDGGGQHGDGRGVGLRGRRQPTVSP
jgi:uncharacterized protein YdhG (YjbR/CyaY superfamily)